MIKPRELLEMLSEFAEMRDMGAMELGHVLSGLDELGRSLEAVTLGEFGDILARAREQAVHTLLRDSVRGGS